MHGETFYTWVHHLCGGSVWASEPWQVPTSRRPVIYLGPKNYVGPEIWSRINSSACPIVFGTPLDPDITVVTTWSTHRNDSRVNDSKFILICHNPSDCWPHLGVATNVFALSPANSRFIMPTHLIPPYITALRRTPSVPVFLVIGGSKGRSGKRNLGVLPTLLRALGIKIGALSCG